MALDNTSSSAIIDQSVSLPDYFSCKQCTVGGYGGRECDRMQAAGRCRAMMLDKAIEAGQVYIALQLPAGR